MRISVSGLVSAVIGVAVIVMVNADASSRHVSLGFTVNAAMLFAVYGLSQIVAINGHTRQMAEAITELASSLGAKPSSTSPNRDVEASTPARFSVKGAHRVSGKPVAIVVEADSRESAMEEASARGVLVSELQRL